MQHFFYPQTLANCKINAKTPFSKPKKQFSKYKADTSYEQKSPYLQIYPQK